MSETKSQETIKDEYKTKSDVHIVAFCQECGNPIFLVKDLVFIEGIKLPFCKRCVEKNKTKIIEDWIKDTVSRFTQFRVKTLNRSNSFNRSPG